VENIDGEAFCCLTDGEIYSLLPLVGHRFKFKQWYGKLRLSEVSFFAEVGKTKKRLNKFQNNNVCVIYKFNTLHDCW